MGLETDGINGDYFAALVPIAPDDFYDLQAIAGALSTPEDPNGRLGVHAFVQVAIRRAVTELRNDVQADPSSDFAIGLKAASLIIGPEVQRRFFGPALSHQE